MSVFDWIARTITSRLPLTRSTAALIPSRFLDKLGAAHALARFHRACKEIPAYRDFLKRRGVSWDAIKSISDFREMVPISDKRSYIMNYDLAELTVPGGFSSAYCIHRSSGFSGKPSYWLRLPDEGLGGPDKFQLMWDLYLNPEDRPTLIIVTFAMGTWASGIELFRLGTEMALRKSRRVTTITPGENLSETLEIIRNLGPHYDQLFLFGYPPFIKRLLDEGRDVEWSKLRVVIGTGAEATTEAWREWVAGRLGIDLDREPHRVFNGYAAADFGVNTSSETPLSILIKRRAVGDSELAMALFGRKANLPNLYQFDPTHTYFEQVDGELVVTVWSGIPLIRYNIHDIGRVLSYDDVIAELKVRGYDLTREVARLGFPVLKAPFLWVEGRSDGTVSIGGANVYPGNIETALLEDQVLGSFVEHFQLAVEEDDWLNSKLVIYLGIRDLRSLSESDFTEIRRRADEAILGILVRDNSEYAVTYHDNPNVRPQVVLVDLDSLLNPRSIKRRYVGSPQTTGKAND